MTPRRTIREQPGPPVEGLPPYTLRSNPAARRMRITVSPRRGVVVTLPAGVAPSSGVDFLTARRAWVLRMLARIDERETRRTRALDDLPADVVFPAVAEWWAVRYRQTSASGVRALRTTRKPADGRGEIVISGAVADKAACIRALNRFVDSRAREVLTAEVSRFSAETGLRPSSVTVRHQRTRWGSCSAGGAISLNRTLLFLPPELASAIIIHELVHLLHHDHSQRFWRALEGYDPQARTHRRAMLDAWQRVPPWAEAPSALE